MVESEAFSQENTKYFLFSENTSNIEKILNLIQPVLNSNEGEIISLVSAASTDFILNTETIQSWKAKMPTVKKFIKYLNTLDKNTDEMSKTTFATKGRTKGSFTGIAISKQDSDQYIIDSLNPTYREMIVTFVQYIEAIHLPSYLPITNKNKTKCLTIFLDPNFQKAVNCLEESDQIIESIKSTFEELQTKRRNLVSFANFMRKKENIESLEEILKEVKKQIATDRKIETEDLLQKPNLIEFVNLLLISLGQIIENTLYQAENKSISFKFPYIAHEDDVKTLISVFKEISHRASILLEQHDQLINDYQKMESKKVVMNSTENARYQRLKKYYESKDILESCRDKPIVFSIMFNLLTLNLRNNTRNRYDTFLYKIVKALSSLLNLEKFDETMQGSLFDMVYIHDREVVSRDTMLDVLREMTRLGVYVEQLVYQVVITPRKN